MVSTQSGQLPDEEEAKKKRLDRRLEATGWALFLIMIGGLGLVPGDRVPEGTWLVGVGLIMLGLNTARSLNGIRTSGFTIVLGTLALAAGLSDMVAVDLPVFPILLILVGAEMIRRSLLAQERV